MNRILENIGASIKGTMRNVIDRGVLKKGGFFSSYLNNKEKEACDDEIEMFFQTSDSRSLPVYKNYRYTIKPGWRYFHSLELMYRLKSLGFLSEEENDFFKNAVGQRAITCSLQEIDERLSKILPKCKHLLMPNTMVPLLKPSDKQINETVKKYGYAHKRLLQRLKDLKVYKGSADQNILEIGYISGGYSLFAFEQIGFSVSGIDNYYGGIDTYTEPMPEYVKSKLKSDVSFFKGDITTTTGFDNESFDVIYSASVLEHITDIPAAFAEMYRLLKKGGIMVHNYGPFFSPSGGHALGILDFSWGHARLNQNDYLRYMDELRPYEALISKEWINKALTRSFPIAEMQKAIVSSGFDIKIWEEQPAPSHQLSGLTREVAAETMNINPRITLADLISQNIFFVATK